MCQNELLVILGAEASLLVFPAAMTVYAKRMDVLSGRSFERSVVSPTNDRHPLRPFRRESRDLLLLIRRLIDLAISRDGPTLPERRGRAFRPDRSSAPSCKAHSSASCGPPRMLSGRPAAAADRNAGAHGSGARPEFGQSSAAIFSRRVSAP
jgi:hypothetical protein